MFASDTPKENNQTRAGRQTFARLVVALFVAVGFSAWFVPSASLASDIKLPVFAGHWHKSPLLSGEAKHGRFGGGGPVIGTRRTWPTFSWDFQVVLREFELRAVGPHIELWVPTGDMRVDSDTCLSSNAADLVITDGQLRYLADQFERVIRPREGRVFGFPAPRDGTRGRPGLLDPAIPADAFRGNGERVVVLVDNIDTGGVTSTEISDAVDRNILILGASGWANSLGAHPQQFGPDPCRGYDGFALPRYTEGLLAHEYNHVLWYNASRDANAPVWVVEGAAEWARWLVGYDDPTEDSLRNIKIGCFQGRQAAMEPVGFNDPGNFDGGPENSLSVWPDPGQSGLCDYGTVTVMTHMLFERYGESFIRDLLFQRSGSGLDRLANTLRRYRVAQRPEDILQDWSTTAALDGILDDGAVLTGAIRRRFQIQALHSTLNFDTPFAYAAPGSPTNGADFVRLRDGAGHYLGAGALNSLRFDAPTTYPARSVEWAVDASGHGAGDTALASGDGGGAVNLDRSIVRSITVDPADPTLSFDTRFDIEPGYDLGVVQVSTDGGATFTSRPGAGMVTALEPDADPVIAAQLPGFNGGSGGWTQQTIDLSDLAGQTVLVAFRYATDSFESHSGLWIDNVRIGSTLVSDGSTLDGWRTISSYQIKPIAGIRLRLVAYTDNHRRAWVADVPLSTANHAELNAQQLRNLVGPNAETVVAIVNHYEPTETIRSAAPYLLTVNGLVQPGG